MRSPTARFAAPLAGLTLGAMLALLTLGGIVHATGSSLACPDWPTCYGSWAPPMTGGVLFEHGHRLLGTAVGLLAIGLAFVCRRDALLRLPSALVVAGIVIQGLLGAATVLLRLSPIVSITHLVLAHVLCAGLTWILVTALARPSVQVPRHDAALTNATLALIALQIVLGGSVRHLGAGLACGDDAVRCAGVLFPSWELGALQMVHRALALVVVGLVVSWALRVARHPALGGLAWSAVALVLAQVALGLASVATELAVAPIALHLLCAVLLLLAVFVARARMRAEPLARQIPSMRVAS